MTTWLEFRSEPVTERPEIEIQATAVDGVIDGTGQITYFAGCPISECKWGSVNTLYSELEEQVYAHEQWHEDGMPA